MFVNTFLSVQKCSSTERLNVFNVSKGLFAHLVLDNEQYNVNKKLSLQVRVGKRL